MIGVRGSQARTQEGGVDVLRLHPGQAAPFFDRREFLRVGGGLAVSGYLSSHAAGAAGGAGKVGARSCILVSLLGAPPPLDMWDLKPNPPAEIRGPFRPIPTSLPGLQVCEHLPR